MYSNYFHAERQTLDVWINGTKQESDHAFVKNGTEIKFQLGDDVAVIKAASADKKQGIIHQLYINEELIEEDLDV